MSIQIPSDIFNFPNGDIYIGKFNVNLNTSNIYRNGTMFFFKTF